MKSLVSIMSLSAVTLFPLLAFGSVAAVKIECNGSDCQNIQLGDACGNLGSNWTPYAIACDDTSAEEYWNQFNCGGSTCQESGAVTPWLAVGQFCDDGGGNDAVVMCRDATTAPASPANSRAIKVECWGDCNNVSMNQVCSPYNMVAVAVACDDAADPGQGNDVGCGTATCREWGSLASSDPLGAYCVDGGGYDAVVTCAPASTASVASVKVECWGSDCNNVTLDQVCAAAPGHPYPLQISCDDTATPGNGTLHNPCGPASWGQGSCTTWGTLYNSDPLGAYCGDGGGNDAVVTCSSS